MNYPATIHFRATAEQSAQLAAQAAAEGVSVAAVLRDAIDAYFAPLAPVIFDVSSATDDAEEEAV